MQTVDLTVAFGEEVIKLTRLPTMVEAIQVETLLIDTGIIKENEEIIIFFCFYFLFLFICFQFLFVIN